jgi:hypothetical protein
MEKEQEIKITTDKLAALANKHALHQDAGTIPQVRVEDAVNKMNEVQVPSKSLGI